jgi:hypothetical protein
MEMANEIQDKATVIKGAPAVEPSDRFFWFNRPRWVLFLIHLTLFQNAFQMAHFVWTLVGCLALPFCLKILDRLLCSSSHCSRMI